MHAHGILNQNEVRINVIIRNEMIVREVADKSATYKNHLYIYLQQPVTVRNIISFSFWHIFFK